MEKGKRVNQIVDIWFWFSQNAAQIVCKQQQTKSKSNDSRFNNSTVPMLSFSLPLLLCDGSHCSFGFRRVIVDLLFTHRTLFARCTHLGEEGRNDWNKKKHSNCYAFIDVMRAYDCNIDLQTARRPGTMSLLSITILYLVYLFICFSRSLFISGAM